MNFSDPNSPSKQFPKIEREFFEKMTKSISDYQTCIGDRLLYTSMESTKCTEAMKPVHAYLSFTRDAERAPYRQHVLNEYKDFARRCDALNTENASLQKFSRGLERYRTIMSQVSRSDKYIEFNQLLKKIDEDKSKK